jgi:uncharacterized protein
MNYVKVRNVTRDVDLGQRVRVASSFVDRAVGLLRTPVLNPGDGLWISPCASIHTFFMRYPIDVLFLDSEGIVLRKQTLEPWRFSGWHYKSRGVMELRAGVLHQTGTQPGDRIEMKDVQ